MNLLIVSILLFCDITSQTVGAKIDGIQTMTSFKRTHGGENSHLLSTHARSVSPRQRRAAATAEELQLYLDKHNTLRRQEGASNMYILRWNSALADMALLWAQNCAWEHGQPPNTSPFDQIGQNLYITTASTINLDAAIQAWYDEKPFYHPSDQTCDPGEQCGHYTQVVWDDTRVVGCAYAFCPNPSGLPSNFVNAQYLVCNYGPAGNYPRAPYTVGPACTQCSSGAFWCNDGLCDSECTGPSSSCECSASCQNCGTVNSGTCTCSCAAGWTGVDCTTECANYHVYCGANPGWPRSWCTDEYLYVLENCPLHCGLCVPGDGSSGDCNQPTTTTTTTSTTRATTPTTTTTTTRPTMTTTTTARPTSTTSTTTTTRPTTTTTTTARPTSTTSTTTTTRPTTTTTTTARPTSTTSTTTTTRPTTTTTTTARPTSTTNTTPTTTSTTTTSTTTTPVCSELNCVNGEAKLNNGRCQCVCESEWQGDTCENRKDEARVGVIIRLLARLSQWDAVWPILQNIIANIVNQFCNQHVDVCCPGATISQSEVMLTYLSSNELVLGFGYPVEATLQVGGTTRYLTLALLYAYGAPGNELCAQTSSSRRRREIPETTLPQDAFYEALNASLAEINTELRNCCGLSVESLEMPTVEEEDKEEKDDDDDEGFLGLEYWIWGLIGAGILICIIFCIICCCCCCRSGKPKAEKYMSRENDYLDRPRY